MPEISARCSQQYWQINVWEIANRSVFLSGSDSRVGLVALTHIAAIIRWGSIGKRFYIQEIIYNHL